MANLLRRFAFTSASALEWILEGFEDAEGNTETEDAEVFGTSGVASIPQEDSRAEAIVAYIGGDQNAPVVLATRDADAVRAFEDRAGELSKGETAVFAQNGAFLKITADGDIIIRAAAGREILSDDGSGAVALATLADVAQVITAITTAVVGVMDGGTLYQTNMTTQLTGFPNGTTVLKGK